MVNHCKRKKGAAQKSVLVNVITHDITLAARKLADLLYLLDLLFFFLFFFSFL